MWWSELHGYIGQGQGRAVTILDPCFLWSKDTAVTFPEPCTSFTLGWKSSRKLISQTREYKKQSKPKTLWNVEVLGKHSACSYRQLNSGHSLSCPSWGFLCQWHRQPEPVSSLAQSPGLTSLLPASRDDCFWSSDLPSASKIKATHLETLSLLWMVRAGGRGSMVTSVLALEQALGGLGWWPLQVFFLLSQRQVEDRVNYG